MIPRWLMRIRERLISPPRITIAAIAPGRRVRVIGRVIARDEIESAVLGERCVYFHSVTERWKQSTDYVAGGARGYWLRESVVEEATEFYIADDTGRVLITPERAEVRAAPGVRNVVELALDLRGLELRICAGDEVEIDGIAHEADDVHGAAGLSRGSVSQTMIAAPAGRALRVRLIAPAASLASSAS